MKNIPIIAAFLIMLAAFVVVFAMPADEESILAENRTMTDMPEFTEDNVFSGKFASQFESFVGDNIGERSFFKQLSKNLEAYKGIIPETGSVISTNKDIGTGTTQKQTLLLVDDTVMEMFMKKPETEKLYTDAVNYYAEKLPENIRLFNMLIPTQLEFMDPIYKNLQDSQETAINDMYGMLDDRVIPVDVCDTLAQHSDEYIYFRTDHHWTELGAYYAYREFMRVEGSFAVDKRDFEKNEIDKVLGYLYDRADRPEIAQHPDTIEWYDIDPEEHIDVNMYQVYPEGEFYHYNGDLYDRTKAEYLFFFGGDHPVVEMTNYDNPDGKTIVVLKDSYTNVFAPWLIKSYERVILIDPRSYKGHFETILDAFAPDEILIMNYVFTTNFEDYCSLMTKIYE